VKKCGKGVNICYFQAIGLEVCFETFCNRRTDVKAFNTSSQSANRNELHENLQEGKRLQKEFARGQKGLNLYYFQCRCAGTKKKPL